MSRYSYDAFGSPMLGSTITTAPRRQGDGMDSESLRLQIEAPSGGKRPPRHVNLNASNSMASLDVDRGSKTYIPKEPVKGAVKPVDVGASLTKDKVMLSLTTPAPVPSDIKPDVCSQAKIVTDTPTGPRTVEGNLSMNREFERLVKEVDELKTQLNNQTKVNTDLKKLLVASMGDDLHYKVDSLVRTRAQLADEIGGYTEKIYQDYETLDKLTIQADMWRSKYTASRVLIDQLAGSKETNERLCHDAKQALTQLLQERTQMADSLKETYRYLKVLKDSFDPRSVTNSTVTIPNILELARTNHLLADSIKFRLLPAMPIFPAALDAGIQNGSTPGEKLALQVFLSEQQPEANTTTIPNRLPAQLLPTFDRFHPHVRYDNITYNCCSQCRGEIHVV